MPLTMADMPAEVQALVSGDLTAGKNQTVTIGPYISFGEVSVNPVVTFENMGSLDIGGGTLPVTLDSLPTTDPLNVGTLWNDGGTVKVSAG